MENPDATERTEQGSQMKRRNVLKAAGVGAIGVGAITGTASATHSVSKWAFFGCSQVCVNAKGAYAVVWTDEGCEKRSINRRSYRGNLDWEFIYCRSVDDDEAIVGFCYDETFQENEGPGSRCAENYDCPDLC